MSPIAANLCEKSGALLVPQAKVQDVCLCLVVIKQCVVHLPKTSVLFLSYGAPTYNLFNPHRMSAELQGGYFL